MEDSLSTNWRKASYSGNGGGSCVEVGNAPGALLVRDTTNRAGFAMPVSATAWDRLLDGIRSGDVNPVL